MSQTRPAFLPPAACLVREVASSFPRALRTDPVELSVERARAQHAGYVAALREAGAEVIVVPADEECPDCCFPEDAAVVLARSALITRPGAASRRPEVEAVAQALAGRRELLTMEAPATLDGGDVLRAGEWIFVGLSGRTNAAGAARLDEVARGEGLRTVTVPVGEGLHLKSLCSLASADLLVHAPGLDVRPFAEAGLTCLPVDEPAGANVLALGTRLLVSADAPRTAETLTKRGLPVRTVHVTEFHRADGALTCLSIRLAAPGGWVT